MFEILMLALFAWLLLKAIKLFFSAAWSITKLVAVVLMIAALPTLIGVLVIASGLFLLLPVALVGAAVAMLDS